MTNRSDSRKKAYCYIVQQAKGINWDPPIDSDEKLADVLMVSLSKLKALKEGLSDPLPKLVDEFKKLLGPLIIEGEIDSYLVTPFMKQ